MSKVLIDYGGLCLTNNKFSCSASTEPSATPNRFNLVKFVRNAGGVITNKVPDTKDIVLKGNITVPDDGSTLKQRRDELVSNLNEDSQKLTICRKFVEYDVSTGTLTSKYDSSVQSDFVNLLNNGTFESDFYWVYSDGSGFTQTPIPLGSSYAHTGTYGAVLASSDEYLLQVNVYLEAGEYTLRGRIYNPDSSSQNVTVGIWSSSSDTAPYSNLTAVDTAVVAVGSERFVAVDEDLTISTAGHYAIGFQYSVASKTVYVDDVKLYRLLDKSKVQYGSYAIPFVFERGENLVINPDMLTDDENNWIDNVSPTTNERSSTQSHSGSYSRKFVVDSAWDGIKQANLTFVAGMNYKLRFWVYPDDTTDVNLTVWDSSSYIINEVVTGLNQDAWNLVERDITIGASGGGSTGAVAFDSGSNTSGTWYVDGVSITRSNNKAELVCVKDLALEAEFTDVSKIAAGVWLYVPDASTVNLIYFNVKTDGTWHNFTLDGVGVKTGWNFITRTLLATDLMTTIKWYDLEGFAVYIEGLYDEYTNSLPFYLGGVVFMDTSQTVEYEVERRDLQMPEENYNIDFLPFTINLVNKNGYSNALSTEVIVNEDSLSKAVNTVSVDLEGSYTPLPRFNIEINGGTNLTGLAFRNLTTDKEISISNSLSSGDRVVFDMMDKLVQVNGASEAFSGTFPTINLGKNRFQFIVSSSSDYSISIGTKDTNGFATQSASTEYWGQSFSTTSAGELAYVSIFGDTQGTTNGTNIVLFLYSDSSGSPGDILAQATVLDASTEGWHDFYFSDVSLEASTTYWLVTKVFGGGGIDEYYFNWDYDSTNSYSGGSAKVKISSWSAFSADVNRDLLAKIYLKSVSGLDMDIIGTYKQNYL